MNNKTFFIIIVILIAVAALGLASYLPARTDAALKHKVNDFPMKVGEWSATDIPLSERDYQILETRNLFIRDYKNSRGESVYFYIIYSEDNRKVSHPPEVCYIGSGVNIVNKEPVMLTDSIKAIKLIVEKGDTRQMVVFWYKAGKLNTDQYLKQQLKVVTDRMFLKRTSGALIRLSADIKDNNQEEALKLIRGFYNQITPLLDRYAP